MKILKMMFAISVSALISPPRVGGGSGNNRENSIQTFYDNPSSDLQLLTHSEASTLTKKWVDALLNSTPNSFGFGTFANYAKYRVDSYNHLFNDINSFERYLQYHRQMNDIYLAWRPTLKKQWNAKETLCVVATNIDLDKKLFNVNKIIESPTWKSTYDIDSTSLKRSLEVINDRAQYTTINFDPLKENSIRYYWSWTLGEMKTAVKPSDMPYPDLP